MKSLEFYYLWNAWKPLFELLYYLSAPALVFFAWRGLTQISVTKEIHEEKKKTERMVRTIDLCKYFNEELLLEHEKLNEILKDNSINYFDCFDIILVGEELQIIRNNQKFNNRSKLPEFARDFVNFYNKLEAFSLNFYKEVTEDDLAYMNFGNTYISIAKKHFPIIKKANKNVTQIEVVLIKWMKNQEKEQNTFTLNIDEGNTCSTAN